MRCGMWDTNHTRLLDAEIVLDGLDLIVGWRDSLESCANGQSVAHSHTPAVACVEIRV